MNKLLTLCLVTKDTDVLLAMKKRGFGAGRWNGFGGKVKEGESIEDAAIRETREEASIEVTDLQKVGIFEFKFEGDPKTLEAHVFTTSSYSGEPTESEEMKPQWFSIVAVPYQDMWPGDVLWMPKVLEGKKIKGSYLFGPNDRVLKHEQQEVESL